MYFCSEIIDLVGIIIPQKLKKNRLHDILDSFLSGNSQATFHRLGLDNFFLYILSQF